MRAERFAVEAQTLENPDAGIWKQITQQKIALVPAPVGMQPSKYIIGKWKDGDFGKVSALGIQAIHNGRELAFRLEWDDENPDEERKDNTHFPDAAALLFPLTENASVFMGGENDPTNIWFWRADRPDAARNNVATGIGTSRVTEEGAIATRAVHSDGRWRLVFRRTLVTANADEQEAQFRVGEKINLAFAVWEGSNAERGGLKSFSPNWLEVTLAE
ncbi:MAG: hypothetical protein HOC23_01270 [Halieaceae bacterium]|jgi:steroid C-25 hydroxylase gamma subunit|nr:hypothetical protein [Halieaceae bacterium]